MSEEMKKEIDGIKVKLTFDDLVIKKIISASISEIDGILGLSGNLFSDFAGRFSDASDVTKGISVEVGTKQVAADISVICEYDVDISNLFEQATEKVKKSIKFMTGLDLVEFNMSVADVLTKDQFLEKYRSKNSTEDKEQ